jgi:intracellular septation protein A
MAATFAQIGWLWFRGRKIDTMLWVSLVIITVFGGMTLALHDETFIKWKPTVLYWAFAAVLLGGTLFFKKNLMRTLLAEQMELPEVGLEDCQLVMDRLLRVHGDRQSRSSPSIFPPTTGSTSNCSAVWG